jgi:hypothetical protein
MKCSAGFDALALDDPISGLYPRQKEKTTLPGVHADVSELACVATLYPRPVWGMLTPFPFDIEQLTASCIKDFAYVSGSNNP